MDTECGDIESEHLVVARDLPGSEAIEYLGRPEERPDHPSRHAPRLEIALPFVARRHGRGHVRQHGV